MSNQIGLTDVPADMDLFEIGSYVKGLTDFIRECKTPMTIAIQGKWGTGKTSVMKMIESRLASQPEIYHCVSFNTWEFAQFKMDGELSLVMIQSLTESLSGKNSDWSKKIVNTVSNLVSIGTGYLSGGTAHLDVKEFFEKGYLQQIRTLKKEFQTLIDKKAGLKDNRSEGVQSLDKDDRSKNNRIVFFIDDLDRLNPEKAVELLEVLKNFLDCRNCVFVLAIDYDVVWRGVAAKYGRVIGDKAKDVRQKGKDFFDKIIQVPFKMPVASYQVDNYIGNCLKEINVPVDDTDIQTYYELVKQSIGTNPRNLKRILNSFALLVKVIGEKILKENMGYTILFAALCMQHAFEKIYNHFVLNCKQLDFEILACLAKGDGEEASRLLSELDFTEEDLEAIQPFMQVFVTNALGLDIDEKKASEKTERTMNYFKGILNMSAITGGASDAPTRKKKADRVSRDNMKHMHFSDEQVAHIFSIVEKSLEGKDKYALEHINTQGYGHAEYRYNGKKFFDVVFYDGDKGFVEIDCIPKDVSLWDKPELSAICDKRKMMKGISYLAKKGVAYKYRFDRDSSEDTDLIMIATACVNDVFSE